MLELVRVYTKQYKVMEDDHVLRIMDGMWKRKVRIIKEVGYMQVGYITNIINICQGMPYRFSEKRKLGMS